MNRIRKEMLDPKSDHKAVNDICRRCRSDEDIYGRSRRTNCLKIHTNDKEFWDNIQKNVELYKASGQYAFDERILPTSLTPLLVLGKYFNQSSYNDINEACSVALSSVAFLIL